MKYYVEKSRYEGEFMVTHTKCGYKNAMTARRAGQKAAEKYIYVEVGQYDEKETDSKLHPIDVYEYGKLKGGDEIWDSLTQASQQALEEVNLKAGDLQPEAKPVQ